MSNGYIKTPNGLTERDFTFENPYDLAPSDFLFAQAVEEEIAQLKVGQPLVILSGETHDAPVQVLNHIGGLTHLQTLQQKSLQDSRRKFLFAYEAAFNSCDNVAEKLEVDIPLSLQASPEKIDPHTRITIDFLASENHLLNSPHASNALFRFIKKHSIATLFNDAMRNYKTGDVPYLCTRDPLLKDAWKYHCENNSDADLTLLIKEISTVKPMGVAIRNLIMAARALERAKDTQTRIIFQQCGTVHVFGYKDTKFTLADSLAWLYRESGARVLPLINGSRLHNIDPEVFKMFPNAFIRRGLDAERFQPTSLASGDSGLVHNHLEKEYLTRLEENYSGNDCPFAPEKLLVRASSDDDIRLALGANIAKHKKPSIAQRLGLTLK